MLKLKDTSLWSLQSLRSQSVKKADMLLMNQMMYWKHANQTKSTPASHI